MKLSRAGRQTRENRGSRPFVRVSRSLVAALSGLLAVWPMAVTAQDCEAVCQASHQLCLDDPNTRPGICIQILDACLERCAVCLEVADGQPCPGVPDRAGDCVAPVCRGGECVALEPVGDDRACDDVDGSRCTQARCVPGAGVCDQSARLRPDGTPCDDELPDFCGGGSCQAGSCIAAGGSGGPDPLDPAAVEVVARPQRVDTSEAFNDCCIFCQHQSLEALRPTPAGPEKLEPDGGLPLRTKYCGEVRRYAVNDERDDPRDILLDLAPVDGFEHFVSGLLQTNCTKLEGAERRVFDVRRRPPFFLPRSCPTDACLEAAESKEGKCIHAELTPAQQFYDEDARYLPISDDDSDCSDDSDCTSRLEVSGQTVCVYGVYAYDHGEHRVSTHDHSLCCVRERSHDHPEIHPFDAIWWRHDERDGWIFGVFQDDSNRYSRPHCGSQNNDSRWSQAPRDVTFRFPFRFPRSEGPRIATLRHVVTRGLDRGVHSVVPLNVTTAAMPDPVPEVKTLTAAGATWLEVVEPEGFEEETQVRISGCVTATELKGLITVRAAVGCGSGCSNLVGLNPNGRHDFGDPGSGFLYDELIFERTAAPTLTVRLRVLGGPGRFNLRIDGGTRLANAADGSSTGPHDVSVGTHTVSQTAGAGTRLSDFRTFISGDCNAQGRVTLAQGEEKTCVITNILLDEEEDCEEQCEDERDLCMSDLELNTPELCQALFQICSQQCNP